MKKVNSIKTKLLGGFLALILIATISMAYIITSKAGDLIRKSSEGESVMLAEEGAKLVATRIKGTIELLSTIALQEEIVSMDWEEQQEILLKQLPTTDYLVLGVVSPDGTARYTDGSESQLGDRDYIIKAFSGEANISDVLISRVTGEPVTMVAAPIKDGDEIVGVLIGRRDGNALSEITKDMSYSDLGYSYMVNNKGTVVAHKIKDLVLTQYNPITLAETDPTMEDYAKTIQTIIDNKSGYIKYKFTAPDTPEATLYAGYAAVAGTNWIFISTADESEEMAPINNLRGSIMLILAITIVILAILIYWGATRITRPTIAMSKISDSIANLDLTVNIPENLLKKKDENGVLARAMQSIMLNLRKIIGEVTDSALQVSSTAQELTATAEQSATASEGEMIKSKNEILDMLQTLSAIAEENAASTEEASSAMVEQSASMDEIAKSSERLASLAASLQQTIMRFKV